FCAQFQRAAPALCFRGARTVLLFDREASGPSHLDSARHRFHFPKRTDARQRADGIACRYGLAPRGASGSVEIRGKLPILSLATALAYGRFDGLFSDGLHCVLSFRSARRGERG